MRAGQCGLVGSGEMWPKVEYQATRWCVATFWEMVQVEPDLIIIHSYFIIVLNHALCFSALK